jgi:hypothetical protein
MDQISNTADGLLDKRLRLVAIACTDHMDVNDFWGPSGHGLSLILPNFSVNQDYD